MTSLMKMALLVLMSLSINGILFNIEVCYGLTKEEINMLQAVDRILLKKIMGNYRSSNVSYYLELGILEVKHALQAMFSPTLDDPLL